MLTRTVEDKKGNHRTYPGHANKFQTNMLDAPCAKCPSSCFWFTGQFCPMTMGMLSSCMHKMFTFYIYLLTNTQLYIIKPFNLNVSYHSTGCTQYFLRRKVLDYDMSRYICCQGYTGQCCCFTPGECGEQSCPDLCLCLEAHCCNGYAAHKYCTFCPLND